MRGAGVYAIRYTKRGPLFNEAQVSVVALEDVEHFGGDGGLAAGEAPPVVGQLGAGFLVAGGRRCDGGLPNPGFVDRAGVDELDL